MQQEAPETFAAFVGLDWADAQHEVCFQAAGSEPREPDSRDHTPEAIEAWGCALQKRCEGTPLAIGLALHNGPSVFALRTYHVLGLLPIHPLPLARDREAFPPRRAQDDPTDAALQRAVLRTHRDQLPPLKPQSPTRRALAPRVEHRRRVVGDTVRSTQRLTSTLQNSCPQGLQGFPDKDTVIFGDVLSRWPTLKAAHLARRAPLETFLREHHGRSADVIAQRITAIQAALPLTTDAGIIPSTGLLVHALVSQLRAAVPAMQAFDHAIAQHAQRPPDFAVFQPRPGAGPGFAPRLLVAFGAQRER
jgi:hypothetical protein